MRIAKQSQNKNPISLQLFYHKNMSAEQLDGLNTSIDPLNIQQVFAKHMLYAKKDSRYCGAMENKRHRYHFKDFAILIQFGKKEIQKTRLKREMKERMHDIQV